MKTVDVGAVIDEGRWTGYQKLLIFGTALTIILDGVDNQLLPNAVPIIDARMGTASSATFSNALAIGPFGMMIGGLMGGVLGDRLAGARRCSAACWRLPSSRSRSPSSTRSHARDCCASSPASASAARCPTPRRSPPSTSRVASGPSR